MLKGKNQKEIITDEKVNTQNPLFKYIKATNNDMFSTMSGDDLQELLYYLENYYLELRANLGFEDFVTFGLELEFENAMRYRIQEKLYEFALSYSWRLTKDGSLTAGAEINSPILTDESNDWINLNLVCAIVNKSASIGIHSGGHIHIGTQVLGNQVESWLNFLKLWSVYENIIFRFSYGEFLTARPTMISYAEPMAASFWQDYLELRESSLLSIKDVLKRISHSRYQAVNFSNVNSFDAFKERNTIEFRCPNGTLNSIIWQNNVNLFVHLLLYAKSSRYNDDIVEKRRQATNGSYAQLKWYGEVYLQQALEFCDLVFTNNFDKVYFLRQYLKSFAVSNQDLAKAKEFTRKINY